MYILCIHACIYKSRRRAMIHSARADSYIYARACSPRHIMYTHLGLWPAVLVVVFVIRITVSSRESRAPPRVGIDCFKVVALQAQGFLVSLKIILYIGLYN